jgi:hypothetical protein
LGQSEPRISILITVATPGKLCGSVEPSFLARSITRSSELRPPWAQLTLSDFKDRPVGRFDDIVIDREENRPLYIDVRRMPAGKRGQCPIAVVVKAGGG